jgi:hypothetical protein
MNAEVLVMQGRTADQAEPTTKAYKRPATRQDVLAVILRAASQGFMEITVGIPTGYLAMAKADNGYPTDIHFASTFDEKVRAFGALAELAEVFEADVAQVADEAARFLAEQEQQN